MKAILATLTVALLAACSSPRDINDKYWRQSERLNRQQYREGVKAAKAALKQGVLGYEDIQCEEEEGWQILWCYRKILKEKYGIVYRVISPSPMPGATGRVDGYQSVVRPIIEKRHGQDWVTRISNEAELYYREHWPQVAHLYKRDRESNAW